MVTVRLRDCTPWPHDLVQVDHAPELRVVQLTGQHWLLQVRAWLGTGQAVPPNLPAAHVRARCCEPLWHDLVQADQTVQAGMTGCKGHSTIMQQWVSV